MILTKNEKKILDYYIAVFKTEPRFQRSLQNIATATGVSIKTVQRANARLIDMGVLLWIPGHGKLGGMPARRNEYTFTPRAIADIAKAARLQNQRASWEMLTRRATPLGGQAAVRYG